MRALDGETRWLALPLWLSAFGLLGAWLAWFFLGEVAVHEVSRQARLEVAHSAHPIAAPIAGKLVSVAFALGQEVRAGEVLAELDASAERLRLHEEESRSLAIPPQIEALRNEIDALERAKEEARKADRAALETARARRKEADAAAEFARDNERRLSELSGAGRVALIEALRARSETRKLNAAGDALSAEIGRVERDAGARAQQTGAEIEKLKREIVALEGQAAISRATVARLRAEIEKRRIRAPADGQIGDIAPLQAGAYVTEGEKLGAVVPPGELKIVAEFPPAAVLGRIRPGLDALMRLDGFPWAQYGVIHAQVSRIATEVRDDRIRVEFAPHAQDASPLLMRHGLPGAVEVDIERVAPAVLVLRAAGRTWSAAPRVEASAPAAYPG